MKKSVDFVKGLKEKFSALYDVTDQTTRRYFATNPSKEELVGYFKIRLMNERWNMVELSQAVANLPIETPIEESQMLAKQAWDEANHFRMVKEVIEHLSGEEVDLSVVGKSHGKRNPSQGVYLLEKYDAKDDELVLALYQYMVEGRASVVWQAMSECIEDQYVAKRYAKIARDERFHSEIGRLKLEKLCVTEEAQKRVSEFAEKIVWDLYENTCLSIAQVDQDLREKMLDTYGEPTRELCVPI